MVMDSRQCYKLAEASIDFPVLPDLHYGLGVKAVAAAVEPVLNTLMTIVIILNTIAMGVSVDIGKGHYAWFIVDTIFALIFIGALHRF